jgi:hypothetical protein
MLAIRANHLDMIDALLDESDIDLSSIDMMFDEYDESVEIFHTELETIFQSMTV